MGILSEAVEITYVNRFAYDTVWISAVDKSVDNVENSWFSTVIFLFFRSPEMYGPCITGCIIWVKRDDIRVMLPG